MRFAAIGLSLLCVSPLCGGVTIERTDPTLQVKRFDRNHPPAEMPTLAGNEAAVTVSNFGAEAHVGGEVITGSDADGKSSVSIKVDTIEFTTKLGIVIWLPNDANTKLKKHEDGHRQIAEHYYERAETVARRDADALLGQTVQGSGADRDSAGSNILKASAQALGKLYLKQIDTPCAAAQDAFDVITAHGTNAVPEATAMKQAIAEADSKKGG